MVEQRKEAPVETSKTLRMLAATALVSALAILLTSPAQAYVGSEGDGGSATTLSVGGPGDSTEVALGLGTEAIVAIAGGAVLLLVGAGAFLFMARHRRIALP